MGPSMRDIAKAFEKRYPDATPKGTMVAYRIRRWLDLAIKGEAANTTDLIQASLRMYNNVFFPSGAWASENPLINGRTGLPVGKADPASIMRQNRTDKGE